MAMRAVHRLSQQGLGVNCVPDAGKNDVEIGVLHVMGADDL
jgi:hypothetical protein